MVDVNQFDRRGYDALYYALEDGFRNIDIIRILIENGADVNCVYTGYESEQNTPLLVIMRSSDLKHNNTIDIIAELLSAGADVNVIDESGRTPLLLACQSGPIELIQKGTSKN